MREEYQKSIILAMIIIIFGGLYFSSFFDIDGKFRSNIFLFMILFCVILICYFTSKKLKVWEKEYETDYTFVYYLTDDNVDIHLQHPHVYEQHNHYISLLPEYKEQYPSGHMVNISPSKGDILMFPSYIPHFVDSNNKSTKRISISWNSDVKDLPRVWKDKPQ